MKRSRVLLPGVIAALTGFAIWKLMPAPEGDRVATFAAQVSKKNQSSPVDSMAVSRTREKPSSLPMPEPVEHQRPSNPDVIGNLPPGEQQSLQRALHDARHATRPLEAHFAALPQNRGVSHFASNPGQDLTARFLESGGARIESGAEGKSWQATLRLKHGEGKSWVADGARTELDHNGVTEWYVNKGEGIEHGFTLDDRDPAVRVDEPRAIEISLEGLRAEIDPARDGDLVFTDRLTGDPILGYRNLKVWDKDGTPLAANMRPHGDGVRILIDDRMANYPVTVDPLIVSMEQRLESGKLDPLRSGSLIGAIAMRSNDTVVVGVAADKSAYVFTRTGSMWNLDARLSASGIGETRFGETVAVGSGGIIVGAPGDDFGYGAAYVFDRIGNAWTLAKKLVAADGVSGDQFGSLVKNHGSLYAVTTKFGTGEGNSFGNAAVYVYGRMDQVWTQETKIVDPDGAALAHRFGASVALSQNFLAVGAPSDGFGEVYVFVRSAGRWSPYGTISSHSGLGNIVPRRFGCSIAISGNWMIVGDQGASEYLGGYPTISGFGHAHVFSHGPGGWTKVALLEPPTRQEGILFGREVTIFEETIFNPTTAVVTDNAGTGGKRAHIFVRDGNNWQRQGTILGDFSAQPAVHINTLLLGPNANVYLRNGTMWSLQQNLTVARPENDHFGLSVDVEGDQAIIGALDEDTPAGASAGAAYLFTRSGNAWTRSLQLLDSTGAAGDRFGVSVGVTADYAIVGADFDDENSVSNCGSATIYAKNFFWGTWGQLGQKCRLETGANASLGRSVAIRGSRAIVGAPNWTNGTGRVWPLTLTSGGWTSDGVIQSPPDATFGVSGAAFGFSVAIDGDVALVGQPRYSPYFPDVGQAHLFRKNGNSWQLQKSLFPPAVGAFPLPERGSQAGFSVALDGNTAVVGANGGVAGWSGGFASDTKEGRAFVSSYSGGAWSNLLELPATGLVSGSHFGMSSAISGDIIAIGAFGNETMPGKVHLFARSGTSWVANGQLGAPAPESDDAFGVSTALSGDTLLVGGYGLNTPSGTDAGAAYVFRVTGGEINAPLLTITRNGSNAVLTWPATPGWVLQRSPNLESGSWQPVTVTTDGTHSHPIITGESRMFFRLARP